jgi:broad specificity phosphatase PhoE
LTTTRLILVRHGETQANREMRYIGRRNDALTEQGQIQARQIVEALAPLPVAAVYSSPLERAYHTARPIAAHHHLEVQVMDELRESDFGLWEGLSRAEVIARSSQDAEHLQAWLRDTTLAPPDGESIDAMHKRVRTAVEQLAQAHADQTIVLVSHVGPIKALLCAALGAPTSTIFRIFLDPATISVVDWQQPFPIVRLVNSHAHLGWERAKWL